MADIRPTTSTKKLSTRRVNDFPKEEPPNPDDDGPELPIPTPKALEIIRVHRFMLGGALQYVYQHKYLSTALGMDPATPGPTAGESSTSVFRKKEPSSMKLKQITLSDMAVDEDKVYWKRILHVTLIEDPMIGFTTSTNSVIRDEDGIVDRLAIYNIPQTEKFRQLLAFGTQLGIINPHHSIAAEGRTVIRVDDPRQIVHYGGKEKLCRHCIDEGAQFSCATCGFRYCSRQCQLVDWKAMKHKMICSKREVDLSSTTPLATPLN